MSEETPDANAAPATHERIALSMTRDDYELLLLAMGFYMGAVTKEDRQNLPSLIGWVNRVNADNRRFAPYA